MDVIRFSPKGNYVAVISRGELLDIFAAAQFGSRMQKRRGAGCYAKIYPSLAQHSCATRFGSDLPHSVQPLSGLTRLT
jgi:precorrin-3B methylase